MEKKTCQNKPPKGFRSYCCLHLHNFTEPKKCIIMSWIKWPKDQCFNTRTIISSENLENRNTSMTKKAKIHYNHRKTINLSHLSLASRMVNLLFAQLMQIDGEQCWQGMRGSSIKDGPAQAETGRNLPANKTQKPQTSLHRLLTRNTWKTFCPRPVWPRPFCWEILHVLAKM